MVNIFIQARTSSKRLPGKVLKPILGKPMLEHQLIRISKCKKVDNIVLLTSVDKSDDPLVVLADQLSIPIFRGSLDDVLSRFSKALLKFPCDHIVRITGDCPLHDWRIIDSVVTAHLETNSDYTTNCLPPSYPDGLDVEVIKSGCLLDAEIRAGNELDREHVTSFIYSNPNLYKIKNVVKPGENLGHLRWTVDNFEDFVFVSKVYDKLSDIYDFSSEDIYRLIRSNPKIQDVNRFIQRNEGFKLRVEDVGNGL